MLNFSKFENTKKCNIYLYNYSFITSLLQSAVLITDLVLNVMIRKKKKITYTTCINLVLLIA